MTLSMNNVMGVIILTEQKDRLRELTTNRALAAVPFGARYRIIDFPLSNLVNAGVRNVGVFVQEKYRSLMDHLGIGKEWDLNRQRDGLFILPPEKYADGSTSFLLNGDILLLRRHLDYLIRSKQEYVILMNNPIICNINLQEVLKSHLDKQADITMVYHINDHEVGLGSFTEIAATEKERITALKVNPFINQSSKLSLDTYIISREMLIDLVDNSIAMGGSDFVRDVTIRNLAKLKIYGYGFEGYARKISSLECYYKTNMELLDPKVYKELFYAYGPIYTKVKNEPPAIYAKTAQVKNSLVANGCKIEGKVENSIVFRGVKIGKNVVVRNSIIMQKTQLESGVELENVILDKDCFIGMGKRLRGDKTYPLVIGKKTRL